MRRGYALLAALWVVVGLSTLAVAASLGARRAIATSGNRAALLRASWVASGCAERARAEVDALLDAERVHPGGVVERWRTLDAAFAGRTAAEFDAECDVRLSATGARVDLTTLDATRLHALLAAVGIVGLRADSLADALLDWQDADDVPRALGAERAAYAGRGPVPRNAPLAAIAELHRVRGFDPATVAAVAAAADVEPGRLSLTHAGAAALATLPGFGEEVIAEVLRRRQTGEPLTLVAVTGALSAPAASALMAAVPQLSGVVSEAPDAWILDVTARSLITRAETSSIAASTAVADVRASDGTAVRARPPAGGAAAPGLTAHVELRLERAAWRAVVVRRRSVW